MTSETGRAEPVPPVKPFALDMCVLVPRYIYTGYAILPWYIEHHESRKYISNGVFLDCMKKVKKVSILPILDIIQREYKKNKMPTITEAARLLAALACHSELAYREYVFDQLPQILLTEVHLFEFMYHYRYEMKKEARYLSAGARRMLRTWYSNQLPEALAEMMCTQKSYHGWTHNDLMRAAHLKFPTNDDKGRLMVWSKKRATKYVTQFMVEWREQNPGVELGPAVMRYVQMQRLKMCTPRGNWRELLAEDDYRLGHIPTQLLQLIPVWEIMLPKLEYRDLMLQVVRFTRMNILHRWVPFFYQYISALGNTDTIVRDNVHPVELFLFKKFYGSKKFIKKILQKPSVIIDSRPPSPAGGDSPEQPKNDDNMHQPMDDTPMLTEVLTKLPKQCLTKKKEKKLSVTPLEERLRNAQLNLPKPYIFVPEPQLTEQFHDSMEYALKQLRPTGLSYFITIDLRPNAARRKIFKNPETSVMEATILMALSYWLPNKRTSTLSMFTINSDKLNPLRLADSYTESLQIVRDLKVKSLSFVKLTAPINTATKNGQRVDVFLTISTFFSNPQVAYNQLLAKMDEYKEANQCNAKYVLLLPCNPVKPQQITRDPKVGILIVTGIHKYTCKIIDAFINGDFK